MVIDDLLFQRNVTQSRCIKDSGATSDSSVTVKLLCVWSNEIIQKCSDFVDTAFLGVFSTVCRAMLGQMAEAEIDEASCRLQAR